MNSNANIESTADINENTKITISALKQKKES